MPVRILLVDDHKIIRQGLSALLQEQPDFLVVGEADNGRSAVSMAATLTPNVVVMDIQMPDLNGIDATRQILATSAFTKVICLSASRDKRIATEVLRAGALAYVAKDSAFEELILAINSALQGRVYISPSMTDSILEGVINHAATGEPSPTLPAFVQISARERETLQLIAEGKSTKEVAAVLGVSVKTIETHRRNLMEKLNIDSVAGLTKFAIREGITSL